ncbi:MAG: hypothetical protein HY720_04700 [Planctomycetes bacterium]|nr:hypothetical protein [Planctomycetota bacterium]
MRTWRLAATAGPALWLAAGATLAWFAAGTRPEPEDPPPPPPAASDEWLREVEALLGVLYPPPAARGLGAGAPEAGVSREALASWLTRIERGRSAPEVRRLYEIVLSRFESLAGREPPAPARALEDADRAAFLRDWGRWARRNEWPRCLRVTLRELWVPGPPPGGVTAVVDDGYGRAAALAEETPRVLKSEAVEGWTRVVLDPLRELVFHPPFRAEGVALHLVLDRDGRSEAFRVPLDSRAASGAFPVWRESEDRLAGTAFLAWEWSP